MSRVEPLHVVEQENRGDCPKCEPNVLIVRRYVEEFSRPPERCIRLAADFYRESA